MLIEYGIRTGHKVADKTESRTIDELRGFPLGRAAVVYLTGEKSITVSKAEIKVLREYLLTSTECCSATTAAALIFTTSSWP